MLSFILGILVIVLVSIIWGLIKNESNEHIAGRVIVSIMAYILIVSMMEG